MNNDTTDRLDGEQHAVTDEADGPVVGFELTLSRNEPAECTLFLVASDALADAAWEEMWITAKEGSFVDLESSR